MKPRRKRLLILLLSIAVLATAATLVVQALRSSLVFFYTPTQVIHGEVEEGRYFRIGGMVLSGSLKPVANDVGVTFLLSDTVNSVAVHYSGILPDLFQEGKGAVAQGNWDGHIFRASEVLAKHDENYMSPEVQEALNEKIRQSQGQP